MDKCSVDTGRNEPLGGLEAQAKQCLQNMRQLEVWKLLVERGKILYRREIYSNWFYVGDEKTKIFGK